MSIECIGPQYTIEKILKPGRDVTIYTDILDVKDDSRYKIFLHQEPVCINSNIKQLPICWQKFDVILTYNDDILKECPNARFLYFCTDTWIQKEDYTSIDTSIKKFLVSNLTGFKVMCKAHMFRHIIYNNQLLFNQEQFVFFRSGVQPILPAIQNNPILRADCSSKMDLFREFQFSLVIENTRERHCYTEKLIDCLITKTIPIYYGCENIQEYFDTTGWILIQNESVEEILEKSKVLHEGYYLEYKDVVEKNYQKVLTIIDKYKQLNEVLATLPEYKE
jgi:hypothetical protein